MEYVNRKTTFIISILHKIPVSKLLLAEAGAEAAAAGAAAAEVVAAEVVAAEVEAGPRPPQDPATVAGVAAAGAPSPPE